MRKNEIPVREDKDILLSALTGERKRLMKRLEKLSFEDVDPTLDYINARTACMLAANDNPEKWRACLDEFKRQRERLDKYKKTDIQRVFREKAVLRNEIGRLDKMMHLAQHGSLPDVDL